MIDLPFNVSKNIDPLIQTLTVETETKKIEPVKYTIKEGDTLSSIAKEHNTTWQRLWSKNVNLNNQNVLYVGQVIEIPSVDEVLADRPLYSIPETKKPSETAVNGSQRQLTSEGNSYEAGQCTWYVKNRRPDIPNSWGNATSWLGNAQRQGWATGSTPMAGAVGWTSGHVVYIESVNSDGSVNYSDMNGRWIAFELGSGTRPANYYTYIY